jgi:hypothetical protein
MAGTARPIAVGIEVKREGRIMKNDIGRCFLEEIDKFIKENLRTLTCSHIYDFYYNFKIINELKKFQDTESWFHFTILKDNDDLIANILTNNLNLGEFILLP